MSISKLDLKRAILVSHQRVRELEIVLERAQTILTNMAKENEPRIAFAWQRWPINHEPLRADAKNLLPYILRALNKPESPADKRDGGETVIGVARQRE